MEWWQVFLSFVADLEWWQIVLAVIAAIFVALLVGTFIAYLIVHFVHKEQASFFSLFYLLFSRKPGVVASAGKLLSRPAARPEVKGPVKFPIPQLLAELEHNHKIVSQFSGDRLLPLQTDVWDAHRYEALKLPVTVRDQLENLYDEMHKLNSIVWLSTELGHRSPFSDELYRKLLTSITERLERIKQSSE